MDTPLWQLLGNSFMWIRVAGLSGALAVGLGAWGAHRKFPPSDGKRDAKVVFDTANRHHFYYTLALMTVPLARHPMLTGSLMLLGTTLFCGTCYFGAITSNLKFGRLAPIGGITLILAWLSYIF